MIKFMGKKTERRSAILARSIGWKPLPRIFSTRAISSSCMATLVAAFVGCGSNELLATNGESLYHLPKETIKEEFSDPPNEYRLVQYQLPHLIGIDFVKAGGKAFDQVDEVLHFS